MTDPVATPSEKTTPEPQGKPTPTTISAKTVVERYFKGLKATSYERREYWINYAFLRGRQWVYWNRSTRRIDDVARNKSRYRLTVDRLSPASRTLMAKYNQRSLEFEVRPKAADQDTIQKAKIGQSAIRDLARHHEWDLLDEDLAWAVWTGGTGAVCIDWDPDGGDYVSSPEEDDSKTGDTCETVLTVAEFVVEPGARRAEKARWWIKGIVLPPETVQAMYGLEDLPPADAESSMSPYNQRSVTTESQAIDQADGTLVLTYYERPNALNKKGSMAVVVANKIVDTKPWPFPFTDKLNLVVMRETPVPGKWAGETVLSKATKVQTAYNAAWSNYMEHLKKVGQARLLIPASQLDIADTIEDDPGKPIKFIDGPGMALPQYLTPPQLPNWVVQTIDQLRNEIDDIVGVHAISRGVAPANIESGDGLQVLAENDSTPIGRMTKERARVWSSVGSIDLEILSDMVTDKRTAVIQHGNQPPMTVPWSGKDIDDQTDVTIPVDAIRPRSEAAMWQLASQMMQMRPDWFHSPADFMAVAETPQADQILAAVDPQTDKARRVCYLTANGQYVPPVDRDNHAIFIHEITNFMQSPRFDQLAKDIQDLFEKTVLGHQRFAEEQMGGQVAKGMMSPGLAAVPNAAGAPMLPMGAPAPGGPPASGPALGPDASAAPEAPMPPGEPTPPVGG